MARRSNRGGRRADYDWSGIGGFVIATQTTANQVQSIAGFTAAGTVIRCRGEVLAVLDVGAANDRFVLGLGIIIATDAQIAAGGTAFPSPISVLDADWLWHGFVTLMSETGTQSDDLGGQVGRLVIDSKAMRKVKANDNIVLVVDGVQLSGTPSVDIVAGVRVLFAS